MIDNQSLRVESGECAVLSPRSQVYQENYRQVKPRTAKEVRDVIGVSEEMAKAMRERGSCCDPSTRPHVILSAATLDSKDDATRARALEAARVALHAYVTTVDPSTMAHLEPVIARYLEVIGVVLNIVTLKKTIEVADGATLTISEDTHLVEADKVIIHGTGKINCSGVTKFKVTSIEGI